MNMVKCPACGGSGAPLGGLWDDCCACCGGEGEVPERDVAEYEAYLSSNSLFGSEEVFDETEERRESA